MKFEIKDFENEFRILQSKDFFDNQNYEMFSSEFKKVLKICDGLYHSFKENLAGCSNHQQFLEEIREFKIAVF